jgi:hypothetical protein
LCCGGGGVVWCCSSQFMATIMEKSEELHEGIENMTKHYESLEGLQFECPQEDFTARWETFHWYAVT